MKEERLQILTMLEKGIINVDEAERLLTVLANGNALDKDSISTAAKSAMNKAGEVLEKAAKKANEMAEMAQPKVESAADLLKEKAAALKAKIDERKAENSTYEDIFSECVEKEENGDSVVATDEDFEDVVVSPVEAVEAVETTEPVAEKTEE